MAEKAKFELLANGSDLDEVIFKADINDDLPHLVGNIDRGLIEVQLVPTGAVLQKRLES